MTNLRPAVFLDRDGVLNRLVERDGGAYSPRRFADFSLFPDTKLALSILKDSAYLLVVVTNQPDIARGLMEQSELDAMHEALRRDTPVDAIYTCTHDSTDDCECRKPKPGMILTAARDMEIDLSSSWTIGDRANDIIAGRNAGTRLIHVASGQEFCPDVPDTVAKDNLLDAVRFIVAR